MKFQRQPRKAVAPVLATLLMIAVAVAMSVIIFMWSQGFLSNTSSATGGQQGAQNQAAQSSVAIEAATFSTGGTGSVTMIVRNVGAVSITLGSLQVSGISSNAAFSGNLLVAVLATATPTVTFAGDTSTGIAWAGTSTSTTGVIAKGGAATIILTRAGAICTSVSIAGCTTPQSGDVISLKLTTTVGTFASAQFTVP